VFDSEAAVGSRHRVSLSMRPMLPQQAAHSIPDMTWELEFANPALEARFVEDELSGCSRRVGAGACVLSGLLLLNLLLDGWTHKFANQGYYALLVSWIGVLICLGFVASRWPDSWPRAWLENCFSLVLVSAFVSAELFIITDDGRFSDANIRRFGVTDPAYVILMHIILLAGVGTFVPLRLRRYCVIALVNTAGAVTAQFGAMMQARRWRVEMGLEDTEAGRSELGFIVIISFLAAIISLMMILAYAQVCKVHRSAYHFYRSVVAASEEKEQLLRHEAEQELLLRTAEATKEGRSRLIRTVMHDLRSPLLSVANSAAVLEEMPAGVKINDPSEPMVSYCIRAIASCSELMQHIVSDMLDFERIDSGKLELSFAPFRVITVLESAIHTFSGLASSKGIALAIETIPSHISDVEFIGDVRRLQQCINNGVSNAIKFAERGCTVTIRAKRGDSEGNPPVAQFLNHDDPPVLKHGSKNNSKSASSSVSRRASATSIVTAALGLSRGSPSADFESVEVSRHASAPNQPGHEAVVEGRHSHSDRIIRFLNLSRSSADTGDRGSSRCASDEFAPESQESDESASQRRRGSIPPSTRNLKTSNLKPVSESNPILPLILEVHDTGAGLTADDLRLLNAGNAFTQVGKGQQQGNGGTGLGLMIVRDILRLHAGSNVSLESAGAGQGATFRLELNLPVAESTAKASLPGSEPPTPLISEKIDSSMAASNPTCSQVRNNDFLTNQQSCPYAFGLQIAG